MSSPSQTAQISAFTSRAKSEDPEVYRLQLTNNTIPTDDDTNADDTLQGSDAFLLGGDGTGTSTSTANNTIPTDDDTNADTVLQGSDASLLGSNATGTGTASFPRTEATARQYVVDDTTIEGDTSSGDDPSHLPVADNTSVPATSHAPATSTIPCADPTPSVTQLPYARLYRQHLHNDTIVGGDGTIPDSSIAAGSDTSASLPRAGDESLDNVTATPALGDATASANSPQVATSVVSGARSWFGVAPMTFALVAVLALLLSTADYSAHASISDQGSLVSWGLDRAVGYVRAYVRQRVRRRVHSGLNPVLSWLSPRVIRWLPTGIIPPEQISRLPLDYIASLHIEYLAEQPVEMIARLPPELISRLPTPVISELPVSSIRQLHLSPTRWLSVGFHAWQRLLSAVSYSVVSHLPSWAPAPFTAWLLRSSLCFASIMICRFIIEQVLMYVVGLLRRLHRRFERRGRRP